MSSPKVSVIMPAYNAGAFLAPAIRCILSQTLKTFELIVVDDGSTDGSVVQARNHFTDARIKWMSKPNCGKPAAVNSGIAAASGELIVLMDADDECSPARLQRQVNEFDRFPHVAAVLSGYDLILNGRHVAPISNPKDERSCRIDVERFRMPSHDPTLMVRSDVARNLPFDEKLPVVEGLDFVLRVGEQHSLRVVPEILYSYRIHFSSITRTNIPRRLRLQNEAGRKAALRRGLDPDALFPTGDWDNLVFKNRHRDNGLPTEFIRSSRSLVRSGHRLDAILQGMHCFLLHPLDKDYYRALVYALLPQNVSNWISPEIG